MTVGESMAWLLSMAVVFVLGFAVGVNYARSEARDAECAARCAPRTAERNGTECFCLEAAR